jgi:hypothetical protein
MFIISFFLSLVHNVLLYSFRWTTVIYFIPSIQHSLCSLEFFHLFLHCFFLPPFSVGRHTFSFFFLSLSIYISIYLSVCPLIPTLSIFSSPFFFLLCFFRSFISVFATKNWKNTSINFVCLSVLLSLRPHATTWKPRNSFHEIWYWEVLLKVVDTFQLC